MYKVGEEVTHKQTGEKMVVIKIGKEQFLCRTKDLREIWFFNWELKK